MDTRGNACWFSDTFVKVPGNQLVSFWFQQLSVAPVSPGKRCKRYKEECLKQCFFAFWLCVYYSTTNLAAQKRRIWIYCLSVMNSQQALLFSESSWCIPKWVQLWWSGKRRGDAWDEMRCDEMQCTSGDTRCTLRDLQLHFGETKSLICNNQHSQYIQRIRIFFRHRMPGSAWRVNFSTLKLAGSQTKSDSAWVCVHVFVIVCVSRKVAWLWGANTVRARPGHRLH